MKSTIRWGLLTVICALGSFTSIAQADDRDRFRERVYERAAAADRDHRRGDSRRYDRDRRDYNRNFDNRNFDRNHRHHRHDVVKHRHYDRGFDRRRDGRYDRRYFDKGFDHRRHVHSHRSFSYYDRFDRRLVPSLKRGFFCDDFRHFKSRHYHVSRSDFYSDFYPRYPYRPFYDGGGRATVIVSIPF